MLSDDAATTITMPASFLQERWFHSCRDHRSSDNVAVVCRLVGPVDHVALHESLWALGRRHEALRTRLRIDGIAVTQRIEERWSVDLQRTSVDVTGASGRRRLRATVRDAIDGPFDLDGGALVRLAFITIGDRLHVLVLTSHHAISDGASTRVLLRDLWGLYEATTRRSAAVLRELPIQFADYAAWERSRRDPLSEAFWRACLVGDLDRAGRPRSKPRAAAGARSVLAKHAMPPISAATVERLALIAHAERATLWMALRACVLATVSRLLDRSEVILGVVHANRDRPELVPVVGCVADVYPLRVDLAGAPSFVELLRRTTEASTRASEHRLPFGAIRRLVADADPDFDGALFDAMLNAMPFTAPFEATIAASGGETLRVCEVVSTGGHRRLAVDDLPFGPIIGEYLLIGSRRGGFQGAVQADERATSPDEARRMGRLLAKTIVQAALRPLRPTGDDGQETR